jgi:hypothetical protein
MTEPDPYWTELRRLLPDADLVLLPPPPPAPPPTGESRLVAAIRARHARDAAHAALAEAWAQLAPTVPRPATVRRTWRAAGPNGELVRLEVVARHAGPPGPGAADVLAAARATVEAAGGAVDEDRWARSAGLRLVTDLAEHTVELYATLDPPGLTATVLGPPLAVPADLAHDLLATGTADAPL